MALDRRHFLSASAAAGSVLAVDLAAPAEARAGHRKGLRRRTFAPVVGSKVTITGHGLRRRATLRTIEDVIGARKGSDESFVLHFQALRHLPDGIYQVHHPRTGSHSIYLGRIGEPSRHTYEAVVNRVRG